VSELGDLRGEALLARLRDVELFEGVSKKGLKRIGETSKVMVFEPGQEITTEATRGSRFHLILDGHAKVVAGGRARLTLGPGKTIGELSLIDGEPRSATVVATEPVRTLTLASWNFRQLLRAEPDITEKILLQLARRLRKAENSPVA
jgi:CRP-like cAMP-binding protein